MGLGSLLAGFYKQLKFVDVTFGESLHPGGKLPGGWGSLPSEVYGNHLIA